jgi:hypothetical protein
MLAQAHPNGWDGALMSLNRVAGPLPAEGVRNHISYRGGCLGMHPTLLADWNLRPEGIEQCNSDAPGNLDRSLRRYLGHGLEAGHRYWVLDPLSRAGAALLK